MVARPRGAVACSQRGKGMHTFSQQIFIEHLLYARHHVWCCARSREPDRHTRRRSSIEEAAPELGQ